MDTLHLVLNFILHLDEHLIAFLSVYGMWTYALLFAIIFCETGLVIVPFLPGDSLLFATGALAASTPDTFNVHVLFGLLVLASILGNGLNYSIGRLIGPKIFAFKNSKLLNMKYLEKAHQFYERHGAKTIILARFLPIIRTFAPFVAGMAYMGHRRFFFYNVISAILWIGIILYLSFLFGNIPLVKENFSIVIFSIILLSLFPPLFEFTRRKYFKSN